MDVYLLLTGVNLFIAVMYGLLAVFFGTKIRLPRGRRAGWRVILTTIFAAMFFVGCAHTHIDLAYDAWRGTLSAHWIHPFSVISHILQGIGGLGFYLLGTIWVKVNIFDKKHFERVTKDIEEQVKLME